MSSDRVPVRFDYALTPDDLRDAVTAQQRRGWVRRLVPILMIVVAAGLIAGLVSAEVWELPLGAIVVAVTLALVAAAAIGGVAFLVIRLALAVMYRWQAQLLIRGNPWLSQPVQATVTTAGFHLRSASEEATYGWSHYPLYLETERSFVLLASKGLGAMSLVLPKRGLIEADPAHLRAILAAHARPRG